MLLRGPLIFTIDLVRCLALPVKADFTEASCCGNNVESSRQVRILKDLRREIEGRCILAVEDLLDTRLTLAHVFAIVRTLLRPAGPERGTLLSNPVRRVADGPMHWAGVELPVALSLVRHRYC